MGCCCKKKESSGGEATRGDDTSTPTYMKINYFCMCIFALLTGCDFAVIIPTLWERLSVDYNASGTFMGLVISAYSFSGVLCGFVMGKISDEVKRTKVFYILCIIFAICGHVLYFFGISKYLILLSRAIAGLSIGAGTVALAYIAKTTNEKQRTSIISLIMASRQFGLMFGPAFNLFLRKFNFMLFGKFPCDRKSSPGLFMFIVWSLNLVLFIFAYRDKKLKKPETTTTLLPMADDDVQTPATEQRTKFEIYKKEFFRVEVIALLSITFFTYFNQTSLETIVTPFTKSFFGWNELHNSILFCIGGCIIIVSYVIVRLLSLKLRDKYILVIGLACIFTGVAIGCATLPFGTPIFDTNKHVNMTLNSTTTNHSYNNNSTNTTIDLYRDNYKLFPAFVLFVFFDVLGLPAIAIMSVSLFTKVVHHDMQGLGQGIQRGVLGIATIVGPLFAGLFITKPIILLACTLTILAFIFIIILFTFKRLEPLKDEKENE